jgi:hypothetical protein
MKYIVYIFILITKLTFGQTVKETAPDIERYVNSINMLKAENKLVKIFYPNMSSSGAKLYGYYLNKNLVLIDASYNSKLGFSSKTFYIDHDKFLKVIYREHYSVWRKYEEKNMNDKFEFDPVKMTYTDTIYSVILSTPKVFNKIVRDKIISKKLDQFLIDELFSSGQQMKLELNEVIAQINSLKFVKEMPEICEKGICGDNLYWQAVIIGKYNIELLIDKLDDSTLTTANISVLGVNFTVADIAFYALSEIIHNLPKFELLGIPYDKINPFAYWEYLKEDFSHRQKFKEAVRTWYHNIQDNLLWVDSHNFKSCACIGEHPNGGHFELKTDKK